jgi:hypothetical protein
MKIELFAYENQALYGSYYKNRVNVKEYLA